MDSRSRSSTSGRSRRRVVSTWPKGSRWATSALRARRSRTCRTCIWASARPATRTATSIRSCSFPLEAPRRPTRHPRPRRARCLLRSRRQQRHRRLPRPHRRLRPRRRRLLPSPHRLRPPRRSRSRPTRRRRPRRPSSRCKRSRRTRQDPIPAARRECASQPALGVYPARDRRLRFGRCRSAPCRRGRPVGRRKRWSPPLAPSPRFVRLGLRMRTRLG
jgi:hypothetical protein